MLAVDQERLKSLLGKCSNTATANYGGTEGGRRSVKKEMKQGTGSKEKQGNYVRESFGKMTKAKVERSKRYEQERCSSCSSETVATKIATRLPLFTSIYCLKGQD